jgi:uncharacterized membrane protein YhhN
VLPFPGGLNFTPNGLLVFSAASSALFLYYLRAPASLRRAAVKTCAIALLALIAIAMHGPVLLIAALVLSAIGDFLLALESEKSFQAGLGSFLLAQIVLIALFATHFGSDMLWTAQPWRMAVGIAATVHSAALIWVLVRRLPSNLTAQVGAYGVVITFMALAALAFAPGLAVTGAALFYVSDTLIAFERFLLKTEVNQHPVISPLVWITYYLAQALIMLGVLL